MVGQGEAHDAPGCGLAQLHQGKGVTEGVPQSLKHHLTRPRYPLGSPKGHRGRTSLLVYPPTTSMAISPHFHSLWGS